MLLNITRTEKLKSYYARNVVVLWLSLKSIKNVTWGLCVIMQREFVMIFGAIESYILGLFLSTMTDMNTGTLYWSMINETKAGRASSILHIQALSPPCLSPSRPAFLYYQER